MTVRFQLVDVFSDDTHRGNPVAVIAGADGMETDEMQRITRWLNLSETTFLLPPDDPAADYRVRIFTLDRELPFAGHPTLGTCHAWLRAGGRPRDADVIVQQCGVGLVRVARAGGRLAFAAPPRCRSGAVEEAVVAATAAVLGIAREAILAAEWVDNGPGWIGVLLASAEAVRALRPARAHDGYVAIGAIGPEPAGAETAYEVRAFFGDGQGGVIEDPVTGSLNASVAQWMIGSGRATPPYVAAQGTMLGRSGRIHVTRDDAGTIWIGGATRTMFEGAAA